MYRYYNIIVTIIYTYQKSSFISHDKCRVLKTNIFVSVRRLLQRLRSVLDHGRMLHCPDAILINGHRTGSSFSVEQGDTKFFCVA